MAKPCRSWWRNCALESDSEILAIDGMEDAIAPIAPGATGIRELISGLARGGGYCLGSGNSVPAWASYENYMAMRDTSLQYGLYPIHH